jgi:hypothetical protein
MRTILLCLVVVSGSCSSSVDRARSTLPRIPAAAIHGRYVLLGASPAGQTQAFARLILDPEYECPEIRGDMRIPMTPRANPHGFPVTVCEALIPPGKQLAIAIADQALSLPTIEEAPARILVMGDTGCNTKDCAPGEPAEPFASLARAAAARPVDVILHMGDYNYRGTNTPVTMTDASGQVTQAWAYDAGDGKVESAHCMQAPDAGFVSQNATGAQPHDSWETWRDELFAPAGELLWAAPWVFARGNHELCSRAGPGWFYFLDPGSNLSAGGEQRACPAVDPGKSPIDNEVLVPPYRVDLGTLHLIVVDSANACDSFAPPEAGAFLDAYSEQFVQVGRLTPAAGTTWLMTHRPLWGVQFYEAGETTACTSENQLSCMNQTLGHGVEEGLGGALPAGIRLSLAGHMHQFQSLTFDQGKRPPQLIVGNSGVSLYAGSPVGTFTTAIDGIPVQGRAIGPQVTTAGGSSVAAYGFLDITYQHDGTWTGALVNTARDTVLATCGSAGLATGSVCELAPGLTVP